MTYPGWGNRGRCYGEEYDLRYYQNYMNDEILPKIETIVSYFNGDQVSSWLEAMFISRQAVLRAENKAIASEAIQSQ